MSTNEHENENERHGVAAETKAGTKTETETETETETPSPEKADAATLRAQLEILAAENERLQSEYNRAKQTQYRKTALSLLGLGIVALVAAGLFPSVRTVLIAVGSIGCFGAVLVYYLTPERFMAAAVGEEVYQSMAGNYAAISAALGLSDERVYIPRNVADGSVRLFVPESAAYDLPDETALETPFVVADNKHERGLSLQPTGQGLFTEFMRALSGPLVADPAQLGDQLTDALIEQFELVDAAEVDTTSTQLTIALDASVYGDLNRFDHPIVSFLAIAVANAQATPVSAEVTQGDDRFEYLVTLRWTEEDSA